MLARIFALQSRLLAEVPRPCLPFADFLPRTCVVEVRRFFGFRKAFVLSDIALDPALPLLRFILAHFLPVILDFLVAHVVEFVFTVTRFGALKIRIKRMSAVYTAYTVCLAVTARIIKVRVFIGAAVQLVYLPLPCLMIAPRIHPVSVSRSDMRRHFD